MRLSHHSVTAVCLPEEAKRAALLFDEVTVAVHVAKALDDRTLVKDYFSDCRPPYISAVGYSNITPTETFRKMFRFSLDEWVNLEEPLTSAQLVTDPEQRTLVHLSQTMSAGGRVAVPLYQSEPMLASELIGRDHKIYRVILDRIPLVDPQALTWEQVASAREDPELSSRFRDLRLWINSTEKIASIYQVADLLDQRISHYREALKKHGLKSVSGSLSVLLDPAKLATASAAVSTAALLGSLQLATATAGIILAAQTALRVTDYLIERDKLRAQYPEIALLNDLASRAEA